MHAQPVMAAIYFVASLAIFVMIVHGLWRDRPRQVYWTAVAMVILNTLLSAGDDGYTHTYRIAALADEFKHGRMAMLLDTEGTEHALPVFVFYGILPYLPGTLLDMLGMPAWMAFRLSIAVPFLVLAAGLQVLLDHTRPADASPRRVTADFLVATLFVLANYVFTLWATRNSIAELWVYCLIPWVVLGILRPGRGRLLVVLFFVQAVSHPIVLAQALVCEIAVPFCLSSLSLREFVRRWLGPLAVALLLASPFWLPQFLWKDFILGPNGLPPHFEPSFRTLTGLVHGRDFRSIGPWLPLAGLVAIVAARGRLDWRFWIATALTVAMLMVQWVGLRPLVMKIPVINMSVFVWRLMLPAAFLAFGAALVGWRQLGRPPVVALLPLVLLSALAMQWAHLFQIESYFGSVAALPDDRGAIVAFGRDKPIYGVGEFLPAFQRLPASCPPDAERQRVTYDDLRAGVVAQKPYLVLRDGPFGFVDYGVALSACENDLVLGPVKPGERVSVGERLVGLLFIVRMALIAGVAAFGLLIFLRRPRTA